MAGQAKTEVFSGGTGIEKGIRNSIDGLSFDGCFVHYSILSGESRALYKYYKYKRLYREQILPAVSITSLRPSVCHSLT